MITISLRDDGTIGMYLWDEGLSISHNPLEGPQVIELEFLRLEFLLSRSALNQLLHMVWPFILLSKCSLEVEVKLGLYK